MPTKEQIKAFIIEVCYEAAKNNMLLKITVQDGKLYAHAQKEPEFGFWKPEQFLEVYS